MRNHEARTPALPAIAASMAILMLFTSCHGNRGRAEPGQTPLIGFSLDSLVVERWSRDVDIFTRSANELGADVLLRVADQDPAVQERQIRELADAGIHVLVVVPNDADRLSAVIAEVRARGIRVLSYDRLVRNADVDLYVSFDNEKVGRLMAESVARAVPRGGFVIINGAKTDNNALMLNSGIHGVLDPMIAAGAIRLVGEIWPDSWDNEVVKAALERVVESDRGVDAVIAGNDMLAEAAISVLSENRLMEGVRIAGQDADLAACQRIAEGSQYATVYKPIERLALKAAGYAVMLARGEEIRTDAVIDDGRYEVPYVRLEPILVTRDLLESTVIKDGFHAAEDVYRNLRK
ncbi:MAG: D-xylose transporter subunit XylF [Spirochaetae bacterium HGW-Spirochaetae-3]|jgi:D-xylose transport system substrate-binding protein|nr:MAG: D-xylose transporter subunit XylF [Spirochaetae bacterium HGW-Spirochaetae-3]